MCLALCWKSGRLEGRWTRLVVCQEIKWTVCPWLQLYTCFYFLNVSAERIEQCVRWTRNIHGDKQTIKKTTLATPTQSWLPDTEVSYSYFRQLRFFFVELRHDVFVTVHHSWVCVRLTWVWMCTRADRAWAWRRACVHGGRGEHVWECLCIV